MVETTKNKKDLREAFREFLFNLNAFLDTSALIENTKVEVLYLQEPEEVLNEYFYSKGLVKIGDSQYPVEVIFDYGLDVIKVGSQVFQYRIKLDQMLQFLNEIKNHGGE